MIGILFLTAVTVRPRVDGLVRQLGVGSHRYAIHLEVQEGEVLSVSDYDILLTPKKPEKSKTKAQSTDTPAGKTPGLYQVRLDNLDFISGEVHRHQGVFGIGAIEFGKDSIPSGLITNGWQLSPFMSFYLPAAQGQVLSDIPITKLEVGPGWHLTGTSQVGVETIDGQVVTVHGTMDSPSKQVLRFESSATVNASSGWPQSAKAKIEGAGLIVSYSIKSLS